MTYSFATYDDLESRWRPLSGDERARATVLLGDASALIRSMARDIDDRIESGTLDPAVPLMIVCTMVRNAMTAAVDQPAMTQVQQNAGPFSFGGTFANPTGDLFLTKAQKRQLGIGVQRAWSVDLIGGEDEE